MMMLLNPSSAPGASTRRFAHAAQIEHMQAKNSTSSSANFEGTPIYTKGVIRRLAGQEVFYILVSAKISE
jgi:hypothetical protein